MFHESSRKGHPCPHPCPQKPHTHSQRALDSFLFCHGNMLAIPCSWRAIAMTMQNLWKPKIHLELFLIILVSFSGLERNTVLYDIWWSKWQTMSTCLHAYSYHWGYRHSIAITYATRPAPRRGPKNSGTSMVLPPIQANMCVVLQSAQRTVSVHTAPPPPDGF